MGFSGTIELLSLHQIINLILQGRRSGILALRSEDADAQIVFRFGKMIHGSSSKQKESVIDFLRDQRLISNRLYEKFQCGEAPSLSILIQGLEKTRKLEIIAALQARAKIVLFETLYWEKGEFTFTDRDINDADLPRAEKMVAEVEQLADQDLTRIIRLKQKIPVKEKIFKVNPDYLKIVKYSLSGKEKTLFKAFDGKKTLLEILPHLEGEELFNLLTILDFIESGAFNEETISNTNAPPLVWDQKFTDFQKVYEGTFKKIRILIQQYCGNQDKLVLKNAFQEARRENQAIWRSDPPSALAQNPLETIRKNVQQIPVIHQVRLLKNSLNTLLLWQLIILKIYAGKQILDTIMQELSSILTVLKKKGNINHQEIAKEIPLLFALCEDFPGWIEQGIILYNLNKWDEALALFQKIPSTHPERENIQQYVDTIKKKKDQAQRIQHVIQQIYNNLTAGNLLDVQKLMLILKEYAPDHPDLQPIKKEFATRFDETIKSFSDLTMIPCLTAGLDPSRINRIRLSKEQKLLISKIDDQTNIKGIITATGLSKLKTLIVLHSLKLMKLVSMQELSWKEESAEPDEKSEVAAPEADVQVQEPEQDSQVDDEMELILAEQSEKETSEEDVCSEDIERVEFNYDETDAILDEVGSQEQAEQEKRAQADSFFSQGLEAMEETNFEHAIDCFEKAIQNFSAGVAYYQYLDRARMLYRDQIVQNLIQATEWYFAQKKYEQTIKYLEQALTLSTGNRELLTLSVEIYRTLNKTDQVEKYLRVLIELEPANADHYVALGKLFLEHGDLATARKQFLLALQWNQKHAEAQRQLNLLP